MRLAAIVGSRNPDGQTAGAVRALVGGAEEVGARPQKFFLPQMHIECCRQCEADGWGLCRPEGRCVIQDDFEDTAEAVREADYAVFATPVYYGDLSEAMRSFLERLRRLKKPASAGGIVDQPAVGICVAGGSGGGAPRCAANLDWILRTAGFDVVDMIPARRQNLTLKRKTLRMVGNWLGEGKPAG